MGTHTRKAVTKNCCIQIFLQSLGGQDLFTLCTTKPCSTPVWPNRRQKIYLSLYHRFTYLKPRNNRKRHPNTNVSRLAHGKRIIVHALHINLRESTIPFHLKHIDLLIA